MKHLREPTQGEGRLSGPYTISITPIDGGDSQTVSAKNIILATGSEPAPLVGDALKVRICNCGFRNLRLSRFMCLC